MWSSLQILHICYFEFSAAYFLHSEEFLTIWKSKSDDNIPNKPCYLNHFNSDIQCQQMFESEFVI